MAPLAMIDTLGLVPLLVYLHVRGETSRTKQADQIQDLARSQFDRFEAIKSDTDSKHMDMVRGWRKELDELTARFQIREDQLRDSMEAERKEERARWGQVVDKYDRERDKLLLDVESKLDRILSSK